MRLFLNTWRLLVSDIDGAARQVSEGFFKLTLERFAFHVAAAGAATEDRELVADKFTAAVGEDGWKVGETCPLLLATFGRRASESEAVRSDVRADLGATVAQRVARRLKLKNLGAEAGRSEQCLRNGLRRIQETWSGGKKAVGTP